MFDADTLFKKNNENPLDKAWMCDKIQLKVKESQFFLLPNKLIFYPK